MRNLEKPLKGLHQAMEENPCGKTSSTDKDLADAKSSLGSHSQQQEPARMRRSGMQKRTAFSPKNPWRAKPVRLAAAYR